LSAGPSLLKISISTFGDPSPRLNMSNSREQKDYKLQAEAFLILDQRYIVHN
jgi:hypothetical protein